MADKFISIFDFYSEKSGIMIDNRNTVYTTNDSAKNWYKQLSSELYSEIIRGVKMVKPSNSYVFGDKLRLENLRDYIATKPAFIKGPITVFRDSTYEYMIPLDYFSFDTKWEATGNAFLQYDPTYPERVRVRWANTGNFEVIASAKNRCGVSDTTVLNVTVSLLTAVNDPALSPDDFLIFPLPANDRLFLKFKPPFHYNRLEIRDISGRLLFNSQVGFRQNMEMDLSVLAKGTYILQLNSSQVKRPVIRKIIIQ